MIYDHLSRHLKIFPKVTDLIVGEFDRVVDDFLPHSVAAEEEHL